MATASIERIAREAGGRLWFQAYIFRQREMTLGLVERARAFGYEALMVTVDVPVGGKRERDFRNDFAIRFRFTPRNVVDFATRRIEANWPIPGGGSPDMGNVSADGKQLWLSGRYDDVVYVFDTATGKVTKIPVGKEPHGLTVWPQPGRYSLGHTGNMR